MSRSEQHSAVWPWWLLVAVIWAGLCALAFMLVPQSDDWTFARLSRDQGAFAAWLQFYQTWTGLWACTALTFGVPSLVGPFWAVRLESLLALSALWCAVHTLLRAVHPASAARSVALVSGGIVALAVVTSQAQEGVYWGATACNYSLGLAWIMLLWAYAYRHPQPTIGQRFVIVALALVAPGFSESVAVIAGGLLGLGFLLRPASRLMWVYALLGLALGSLPVIFCPGNAVRLVSTGGVRSLAEASNLVFSTMSGYADGRTLLLWSVVATLPTVCGRTVGFDRATAWRAGTACAILLAIGWAAMMPAALATGEVTPHIANLGWYATFGALLISGWCAGGWLAGRPTHRLRTAGGACLALAGIVCLGVDLSRGGQAFHGQLAMLLLGAVIIGTPALSGRIIATAAWGASAFLLLQDLAPDALCAAPRRAQVWRERDGMICAAVDRGETVVLVTALPDDAYPHLSFLTDLTLNPNVGWSGEIAQWYGVRRIWVDQRSGMSPTLRATWEATYAAEVLRYDGRTWQPSARPAE